MVNTTLLISETNVKKYVPLDENLYGGYLSIAIYTAQERYMPEVLGRCLYRTLQEKIYDGTIQNEENTVYKNLLDTVAPYLAWMAGAEAIMMTYIKVANLSVARMSDTGVNFISEEEMNSLRDEYTNRAAIYRETVIEYLRENSSFLPELQNCSCDGGPQYTLGECSIFLGGPRNPSKKYLK